MKKLLLFLIAFAVGCSDNSDSKPDPYDGTEPPDGAIFSKSLIQSFVFPTEFDAHVTENNLYLNFKGRTVSHIPQDDKEEYTSLCEKFNDLAYNNKIIPFSTRAFGEAVSAIDVVCDKAIDANHSAGASLNDLITIYVSSYKAFIENGYIEPSSSSFPDGFELSEKLGRGCYSVFKPLNELNETDLKLAAPSIRLRLPNKLPAGPLLFTITVTTESGTLTQTVEYP